MPGTLRSSLPIVAAALLGACAHQGAPVPPAAPTSRITPTPSARPAAQASRFSEVELERIDAMQAQVRRAANTHGIPSDLINAVIWVESRFDPGARSPAGARGLMQLMPATARALAQEMGVRPRAFDPEFNVSAGTLFLAKLLQRYQGNEFLALAAYHSGPGTVDGWRVTGSAPDYSRRYVEKVQDARLRFVRLAQERQIGATPVMASTQRRIAPPPLPPTPGEHLTMAEAASANTAPQPVTVTEPMEPRGPGVDPDAQPSPLPTSQASPAFYGLPVTQLPDKKAPDATPSPVVGELEDPPPRDDAEPPPLDEHAEPEVGVGVLPSLRDL